MVESAAFLAAAESQGWGQPPALGPDDKPAFPSAPEGFDKPRDGVPEGTLQAVEYDSKSVGTRRQMIVYTPPGYTKQKRYPAL